MAIDREKGVSVVTVGDLLNEDLTIPPYQRPYSWEPATALQLFDDIREAFKPGARRQMRPGSRAVVRARCSHPPPGRRV